MVCLKQSPSHRSPTFTSIRHQTRLFGQQVWQFLFPKFVKINVHVSVVASIFPEIILLIPSGNWSDGWKNCFYYPSGCRFPNKPFHSSVLHKVMFSRQSGLLLQNTGLGQCNVIVVKNPARSEWKNARDSNTLRQTMGVNHLSFKSAARHL